MFGDDGPGGGGFMARRAATRMATRQQYRTMSRMSRRRARMMGESSPFDHPTQADEAAPPPVQQAPPPPPPAAAASGLGGDIEAQLAQLKDLQDKGLISAEDVEAKRRQLLGI